MRRSGHDSNRFPPPLGVGDLSKQETYREKSYMNEFDYVSGGELTVTITLSEYRDLIQKVEAYTNALNRMRDENQALQRRLAAYEEVVS